ncbi:MAG: DUF6288 domain-containing protein [Planctomycetota bacterium]|nr:DUF6288 domain-containing protein [Planctomycetota bacterium]
MNKLLLLLCSVVVMSPGKPCRAQAIPKQHDDKVWSECKRCRMAYAKALEHTLTRLRRASFPAKMIMGWLLLADGRHPQELESVIDEAMRWRQRVGEQRPHNHRRNWYPALAGILLAEYSKFKPSRKTREALQAIVDHFVYVQERTGGWYKWKEGAYKDRLDYPVKDLGILNAMIFGMLCTVKAQGVNVPTESFKRADDCLNSLLSSRGVSYGTGSRGGDTTGARGAFALNGLVYAQDKKHRIHKIYANLLPQRIPKMDQGHHVGAFHCLGVTIGCHLLGPKVYKQLTDHWLDRLIDKQQEDGGIYVGDDGDAGGEKGLLGSDDGSTAAAALLILLQDPSRLKPSKRPKINWLSIDLPDPSLKKLQKAADLAAAGKLGDALIITKRSMHERNPDDLRAGATTIHEAIEQHAQARLSEAESSIAQREILYALSILEPLSKAMPKHAVGAAAKKNLERIQSDQELQRELKAERALDKAWQRAYRSGLRKARAGFEKVIKDFSDTLAADKAKEVLR